MVAVSITKERTAAELRVLARRERDGRVGARRLALANALDGMGRGAAARAAGMDRQTLRDWVHRYNAEGIEGLRDRPRAGRHVPPGRGPAGGAQGAGAPRSEAGAGRLRGLARPRSARPGRAPLRGRLQRDRDAPAAARARPLLAEGAAGPPRGRRQGPGRLQKSLPALMREAAARHPEAKRGELWFEGEARIGQKGRTTHVWYQQGRRPRGLREQRFASVQLFGAVCPERGAGVALAEVSTGAMTLFLAELAWVVPAGTHAVLVLDRAGWHVSGDLIVPANLTLVHLPPYSPELNPVERVWLYLRERWLSHRVLAGYDAVLDATCAAWNALRTEPGRLRSLTAFPWLPAAVTNS